MSVSPTTIQGVLAASVNSKKRQSISSVQSQSHKKPRLHPLRQTSYPDGDAGSRAVVSANASRVDIDGASITGSFTGSFTGSQFSKRRKSKKDRDGTASVKGGGGNAREDGVKPTTRGASIAEEAEDDAEGNDEEEDIEDDVDLFAKDEAAASDSEAEKKNLAILVDAFTPEQSSRYDFFKRAKLNKAMVRKIVNQTLSQSVPPNVITTISGYTKVFVGELIERARTVQEEWAEVEDRAAIERILQERAEARKKPSLKEPEDPDKKIANATSNTTESEKEGTQGRSADASPTDKTVADDVRNNASASSEEHPGDTASFPQHELPPNPHRGPLLPQHVREALKRYKHDGEGGGVGFSGLSMGSLGVKGSYVWSQGGGGRRLFR
ncbi:hypothetical protein KEM54_001143 [Ascosphaera aggregata]|nr:hypothetical protein KEM54_001143 [Ascosphaera aggregata]